MTATLSDQHLLAPRTPDSLIKISLQRMDDLLVTLSVPLYTGPCRRLGEELRQLHARFRAHDATCRLDPESMTVTMEHRPELNSELRRIRAEHPHMMGLCDWLTRYVDSIANQSEEDQEVFLLRVRELIAVFRRHEAEEDRIYYRSAYEENGGEGG